LFNNNFVVWFEAGSFEPAFFIFLFYFFVEKAEQKATRDRIQPDPGISSDFTFVL